MPAAEARVATARAERYLTQLCEHVGHLRDGHLGARLHGGAHRRPPAVRRLTRTGDGAVLTFDWGTCTLTATPDALTLRAEASDESALAPALDMLNHRVRTIGRRERLTVIWHRGDFPGGAGIQMLPLVSSVRTSKGLRPCSAAVTREERMAAKSCAPASVRVPPDTR